MIDRLDHLVLTVADIDRTVRFYGALGMRHEVFGDGRHSMRFGTSKINLHQVDRTFEPKAASPTPGSADLCFIVDVEIEEVRLRLEEGGIAVVEGPVARTGALGSIVSYYVRDPDDNLVELSVYTG